MLGFGHDVAPRRVGREGMPEGHAGDAGDGGQEAGCRQVRNVVDVVALRAGTVEAILMARGVVADVEIVIAGEAGHDDGGFGALR